LGIEKGRVAVTSTEADTSPTSSLKSMTYGRPAPMCTPFRRAALKPGDCTAISYSPGKRNGRILAGIIGHRGILVPVWVRNRHFAPGTVAPVGTVMYRRWCRGFLSEQRGGKQQCENRDEPGHTQLLYSESVPELYNRIRMIDSSRDNLGSRHGE